MGLFVYSPSVRVIVDSTQQGTIDISEDIVQGQVMLLENGLHTMNISLLNKKRKYDRAFSPNDRFVIYMKRINELLVMSGYLNRVPYVTAWQRTVAITGSCANKKLLYHYWDSGSPAAFQLMSKTGNLGDNNTAVDGGIGAKLETVLTTVAGMAPSTVHLGQLPPNWLRKITAVYNTVESQLGDIMSLLGGGNTQGGTNPSTSIGIAARADAPPGASLPTVLGTVTGNGAGALDLGNAGVNGIGMQWGYRLPPNGDPAPGIDGNVARAWLAQRKIVISNPFNNKGAILVPNGWAPGPNVPPVNKVPPAVVIDGGMMGQLGLKDGDDINIAWVNPTLEAQTNVGLYTPASSNSGQGPNPAGGPAPSANYQSGNPGAINSGQTISGPAAVAVNFAVSKCQGNNIPYVYGGTGPNGYDCSGLTSQAWAAAGVTIPRTSEAQYGALNNGSLNPSNIQPGDLVFSEGVPPGHVVMYIGGGNVAAADHTGTNLHIRPMSDDNTIVGFGRPTGGTNTGATYTAGAGGAGSGGNQQPQQIITNWDWYGQAADPLSSILSGPRALMNDTPILPFVDMLCKTSMRSWCSAPNGDFISWFPDYFGVYGSTAIMDIADIELQDFTIVWSDESLVTHQFVAGTTVPTLFGPAPGGPVAAINVATTMGIATVEFPELLQALLNIKADDTSFLADPNKPNGLQNKFLQRYGVRPNFTPMETIVGHFAEFWYAVYLFQQNWASQFSAQVPITFMPEIYPGMIMRIQQYGFQAYVTAVTHSFNFQEGGGFTTDVTIIAPSATDGSGLYGLPKGGFGGLV